MAELIQALLLKQEGQEVLAEEQVELFVLQVLNQEEQEIHLPLVPLKVIMAVME